MMKLNKLSTWALAIAATASGHAATVNAVPGWNLLGYSDAADVVVADAFGNAGNVTTVWKWNATLGKWAFYTPAIPDGGQAYAATKGYEFLTTLQSGDGFWVNAKASFTATLPAAPVQVINPEALAGISDTLKTFENLYATSIPAANDPTLSALFADTLLSNGSGKAAFLQAIVSGDGPGVGDKIGNVVLVNPTDTSAAANDATHQWFTFVVTPGGGPENAWLAIKNAAGSWQIAGDQRLFDFYVNAVGVKHLVRASGAVSYTNQISANVEGSSMPADITVIVLTGPGVVPATGVAIYSSSQGKSFTQPCFDAASTNCINAAAVGAGARYTIKTYTTASGPSVPAYSYTNVMQIPPLPLATLPAAAFPSITSVTESWASGASITVNWTLGAGTQADWVSVNAWQSSGGQLFNNVGTSLSGSTGSATLVLPSYSGTIGGRNIWLSAKDASGNHLALDYQL